MSRGKGAEFGRNITNGPDRNLPRLSRPFDIDVPGRNCPLDSGSLGAELSYGFGDLAVRLGFAKWNRLQISPDLALERSSPDVQWQRRIQVLALYVFQERAHPGAQAAFILLANGEGEFPLQSLQQLAIGFAELDAADTFFGGSNEHAS